MKDTMTEAQEKDTEQLAQLLREKIIRENPKPGLMQRDAHPKQHGLVRGRFTVSEDLPENFRLGIFQPGKSYECWIRFSNQNAPVLDDWKKDIRGMAIKLVGVPGKKLLPGMEEAPTQDFILISTPKFVTKNLKQFLDLIKRLVGNSLGLNLYLLLHPRIAKNILQSKKRFFNPGKVRYWSTTPYYLGEKIVKYSAIPHEYDNEEPKKSDGQDFLRDNLRKYLEKSSLHYDFCIQFHKDSLPLDDVGVEWNESVSPFIKVATIDIPAQIFDTEEQSTYGRKMSFNPWHCLAEHTPTGDVNHARKVIYDVISKFRHKDNGVRNYEEPNDLLLPSEKVQRNSRSEASVLETRVE